MASDTELTLPSFSAVCAVSAHGRLWLFSDQAATLAGVDLETMVPNVRARLDPPVDPAALAQLFATHDSVWVAREGQVVAVDPWSGEVRAVPVPQGGWTWGTDGDTVWATAWPSGDVLEIGASGAQRTVTVGGHLTHACVSGGNLWVVDRADETLLALDTGTLQPMVRIPFDGGRVEALVAWHGGVLVQHSAEEDEGSDENPTLDWVDARGGRQHIAKTPAGAVLAVEGDHVWVGRSQEPPIIDRRDAARRYGFAIPGSSLSGGEWPDSVGTIHELGLPGGQSGRRVSVTGDVYWVTAAGGRLWVQGYVRSRNAYVVTVADPDRGVIGDVDLSVLGLPEVPAEPVADDPDAIIDQLPGEVRRALTVPEVQVDPRTGAATELARMDRRFTLVDVWLEPESFDVLVTYGWADEPGKVFGYVYAADADSPAVATATDLASNFSQDLDDGLLSWGQRDESDGVVWVSYPDAPPADA